jgi:hypothetical protein
MTIKVNFLSGSYTAADLIAEFGAIRKNGVLSGGTIAEHSPQNLSVDVAALTALYNGLFMKNDATVNVPITSNVSGYSRIDSIALDFDNSLIIAVMGTPGGSPTPPVLTGNKLAIANVTVGNNVSSILNANIADIRSDVPLITDLNALSASLDTGFYICDGTAANIPAGATNGGTLIHMARKNRVTQLFLDYSNVIAYVRAYTTGSVWSAWEAIATGTPKDTWHTPTFVNSWADYGGIYPVRYMKDALGFVHLKGLLTSGTINATAFNLPAGYRPPNGHNFPSSSAGAFAQFSVASNGDVKPLVGANSSFSLDGCIFATF